METFEVGEYVWSKMTGFPFWPSQVIEPFRGDKGPDDAGNSLFIHFFGTDERFWVAKENIRRYEGTADKRLMKKKQTPKWKKAIKIMQDEIKAEQVENNDPSSGSTIATIDPKESVNDEAVEAVVRSNVLAIQGENTLTEADEQGRKRRQMFFDDDDSLEERKAKRQKTDDSVRVANAEANCHQPDTPLVAKDPTVSDDSTFLESTGTDDLTALDAEESTVLDVLTAHSSKESPSADIEPMPKKFHDTELDLTRLVAMESKGTDESTDSDTNDLTSHDSKESSSEDTEPIPKKFGFIGLDTMGIRILKRLIECGHEVSVYNDNAVEHQEAGANYLSTPNEVVIFADITFCSVADSTALRDLISGTNGTDLMPDKNFQKGFVEINSTGLGTLEMNKEMEPKPIGMKRLEVQVFGLQSRVAESVIMLTAGDEKLYEACKTIFDNLTSKSFFLGETLGHASRMNLVLQTISSLQTASFMESLNFARGLGLKVEDVLQAWSLTKIHSESLMEYGLAITESQFGFLKQDEGQMKKNIISALTLAKELNISMPMSKVVSQKLESSDFLETQQNDNDATNSSALGKD